MRIAMIASEAAPFVKTGGLGDVLQALPEALAAIPHNELCVILPCYRRVKERYGDQLKLLTHFEVRLGWRHQYVGILKLQSRRKKLQYYFIDNEFYFGREGIYGYGDDGERFAYYSRAAMAALAWLDFQPDIIHCHDWQTGLVPLFVRSEFADTLGKAKLLFTIHNVEYQGWTDQWFFHDMLELPQWCFERLSMGASLNFMKGAIETSDRVSTVSRTYAKELLYSYYAHGMEQILQYNQGKLCGIVNGIDTTVFSPEKDNALFHNYGIADFAQGKAANKAGIQKLCGLKVDPKVPMLAMITRLAGHKGIDLLCYIMDELMQEDVQFVLIGTGEQKYEQALKNYAAQYPGKLSVNLCFNTAFAAQLYAGADIYLMPSRSEPCGLSQLIAMHYGTVPVVNETGGLKDTVTPYCGDTGEGFTFQSYNADDFLGAVHRALAVFRQEPEAWEKLVTHDMAQDVTWEKPAQEYMKVYREMINE